MFGFLHGQLETRCFDLCVLRHFDAFDVNRRLAHDWPHDFDKARTQILGRYSSSQATAQCLKPPEVIDELLSIVFRIEQLAWVCSIAAGIVTSLLLGLVVNLSMQLRESEMQTMFRLGCGRMTIAMLHSSEIVLLLCAASVLASAAALLTLRLAASVLRSLLF